MLGQHLAKSWALCKLLHLEIKIFLFRKKSIIGLKVGLILFSILKIFHIIRVKLILETANY